MTASMKARNEYQQFNLIRLVAPKLIDVRPVPLTPPLKPATATIAEMLAAKVAVNALAARLGSNTRVFAFNRSGMHNWCLLFFTTDPEALRVTPESLTDGDEVAGGARFRIDQADDAMDQAVALADAELQIDGYVSVRIECSSAAEIIADMRNASLKDIA
jgi:hypothetical protein